jgi:transposase-like protein
VMKLYLKGNSYRDIEDITSTLGETVSRTTVMNWVKKRANN